MSNDPIDVLVVGAGPAGATLAIDLRRRGHTVRIIDASRGAFDGSRAKGVQPRTLEVLEDLDTINDVLAGGSTYPLMGIHLGPLTAPWPMNKTRQPRPGVPYPNTWLIPQDRTNAALHASLGRLGPAAEFGKTLTALTQDDETVTATIQQSDEPTREPEQVTARYLVGADGASSRVRKALGIEFAGSTDDADRVIIADAETSGLSRSRWHVWPGLGRTFVGACPLPHSEAFQWMIRISPEETPDLGHDAIRRRIADRIGPKVSLGKISWTSVFRPNIRLAGSYRQGRVFITGDAAHVHTPAGAQGLNTGIQDSYNLGWKLSQVMAGAPAALLDSYEAERRPIAAAVLGLSTKKYEGLGTLDLSSITRGDAEQQLGVNYRHSPLTGPAGQTGRLQVGDRAPDARLTTAAGTPRRLFDVLHGPQFTLIGFGAATSTDVAAVPWPDAGAGLTRIVITAEASTRLGDPAVLHLVDTLGEFADVYRPDPGTLLLVRPDGYLAAIIDHTGAAAFTAVAATLHPSLLTHE